MLVPHTGIARLRFAGWAVLLSLLGWVTWLAATLETGTDTLAQDLHVATFGWLGPDPNRFLKTFPDEQAEFWIDLVQRDVDAAPNSVDRLIEGAWLLTDLGNSTWGKPQSLSLNSPLWNVARRGLISRARELAPDDLRVWRNIAYLTAEFEFYPNNPPASEPTLATLRAAQQHDQDNALYDYLAAFYLDGRSSFGRKGGGKMPHADELSSDDGQWFLQRMSSVAQLPFAVDGGDRHLLQRRCLARLPIGSLDRQLIANEFNYDFESVAGTVGEQIEISLWSRAPKLTHATEVDAGCWGLIRKNVSLNDFRRQFTLGDPQSPTVDLAMRHLECTRLEALANTATDDERAKADRAVQKSYSENEVAEFAYDTLFEKLVQRPIDRSQFSSVTRSFSLLAACVMLAAGCLGIPFRIRNAFPAAADSSGTQWIWLVLTLIAGIACALVLSAAVFLSDRPPVTAVVGDVILWMPVLAFVLVCAWTVHRVVQFSTRRRSQIIAMVLGGLFFAGWGLLYWHVTSTVSASVRNGVCDLCGWLIRKTSLESEFDHFDWFLNYDSSETIQGFVQAAALLVVPLGFVIAAGLRLNWIAMSTPGAQKRTLGDWILGRKPQVTSESVACDSGWLKSVVDQTSRGWLTLGLWLLAFWLTTTALQMHSNELSFQRAFGTGATPEGLWREYQHSIDELRRWSSFRERADELEAN